jgi:hypothetical protein
MNAITNTKHHPVDIDSQLAAIALNRLDPLRRLRDRPTALGLDQRVAMCPIHTKAGASTRSGRHANHRFRRACAFGEHEAVRSVCEFMTQPDLGPRECMRREIRARVEGSSPRHD